MTDTALPLYELGSIPNQKMKNYRLSFRIDVDKLFGSKMGVFRQAVEIAQATLKSTQTIQRKNEDELLRRLIDQLQVILQTAGQVQEIAVKSGLMDTATLLVNTKDLATRAQYIAKGLPSILTGKEYNKHRSPCFSSAASAAAGLASAVEALKDKLLLKVAYDPSPAGQCCLDNLSGKFEYIQGDDDSKPFDAEFSADIDGRRLTHKVTIAPVTGLSESGSETVDMPITRYVLDSQLENKFIPEYDAAKPGTDKRKECVITGLDVTLDQKLLDQLWQDITVYGHIVRIPDPLAAVAARTKLNIYARYVVFASGASIDVSGKKGEKLTTAADDGKKDGENGKDGCKGNKGEDGGSITIVAERIIGTPVLIANGGAGGSGQQGGSGAKGKQGDPGRNDEQKHRGIGRTRQWYTVKGTPGGRGYQGGKGGRAGQRGDHGNAGEIIVETIFPHAAKFCALPGQCLPCDPEANRAAGGLGGDGGPGGVRITVMGTMQGLRYDQGPEGPKGDDGDKAPEGVNGAPGKVSRNLIGYSDLYSKLALQKSNSIYNSSDSTLLAMTLFAAERLYLNMASEEETEALRSVLTYASLLTKKHGKLAATDSKAGDFRRRCLSLKANLDRGLDYYGNPHDFVHSLSFDTNEQFYVKFRDIASHLQEDYDKFWDKQKSDEEKRDALSKQVERTDKLAAKLRKNMNDLNSEAEEGRELIYILSGKAISQKTVVGQKLLEFETELKKKQVFDALMGFADIAWSFVPIASNMKPFLTNGVAVLEEWFKDEAPADGVIDKDDDERIPEKDQQSKSGKGETKPPAPKDIATAAFGKIKGGCVEIYKDYNKYFSGRKPGDLIKLGIEEEDLAGFDKEIEGFLGIDKARELKKEMHEYFNLVSQRNKAILKRDSDLKRADDLRMQIAEIEERNNEIKNRTGRTYDPKLPDFLQYMSVTTQSLKSFIIETLYMMSRSVDYYTLERKPLRLMDFRVSALEDQYAQLLNRLQEAMESMGPRDNPEKLSLFITSKEDIELLKKNKPVWIMVPLNTNKPPAGPFAFKERPVIKQIECYLDGVESSASKLDAIVTIENAGNSFMFNGATRERWSFTHSRRTISFQYNVSNPDSETKSGDLTEKGKFIELSPFGLWGVQIRKKEGRNEQLDLSKLKQAELRFTAICNESHICNKETRA